LFIRYWDYTIDAGPDVYKAPVFDTDPEIGFGDGGSVAINELGGKAGGYIVDNGAFAYYRVGITSFRFRDSLIPLPFQPNLPQPHYLVRNFTADDFYNPGEKYGVGLSNTL
jgi:tyrosinase